MKKRNVWASIICIAVLCGLFCAASAAGELTGEWKGSASVEGLFFPLSVTISFNENGSFSLGTSGLTAKGRYATDGKILAIQIDEFKGLFAGMLQSPKEIGEIHIPINFEGNSLSMSANVQGVKASMTLKRK